MNERYAAFRNYFLAMRILFNIDLPCDNKLRWKKVFATEADEDVFIINHVAGHTNDQYSTLFEFNPHRIYMSLIASKHFHSRLLLQWQSNM